MIQNVTYYAVIREAGASWDASRTLREQERWDEHAGFMEALVEDGFVLLGGPLEHGPKTLLIVQAESEQAIISRLAHDPWTPMGLLHIATIERWDILLGDWPRVPAAP
jgi:uncharacterized protein YciI